MARSPKMSELQARKRALIEESEVYRQTLAMDFQNLQLYGVEVRRKIKRLQRYKSLFLAAPVAVSLFRSFLPGQPKDKRQSGWRRTLAMVLMGWRFYRKFGPALQTMIAQQMQARAAATPDSGVSVEEQAPAAGI